MRVGVLAVLILVAGCSSDDVKPDDGGLDAFDAPVIDVAADVPSLPPQPELGRLKNNGGPVLAAPHVIPVFFSNDAFQPDIEAFFGELAASSLWTATTAEYGVGSLAIDPSIVVTDVPPTLALTGDIATWIATMADGTHSGWPKAQVDHPFVIFYPTTSKIGLTANVTSCGQLYGFHGQGQLADTTAFTFAAIARCPTYNQLTGVDAVTPVAAHEVIETASDPLGMSTPAWRYAEDATKAWELLSDENADWCTTGSKETAVKLVSHWAQRSWSNVAAAAFHDPCVPAPSHPYFVAAPALDDVQLAVGADAGTIASKGLVIAAGASRTVNVGIFGDGAVTGITLSAVAKPAGAFTFAWETATGNVGDVVHLTITVPGVLPQSGKAGFTIIAKTTATSQSFPVLVVNQ